jgi:hypothetical protein
MKIGPTHFKGVFFEADLVEYGYLLRLLSWLFRMLDFSNATPVFNTVAMSEFHSYDRQCRALKCKNSVPRPSSIDKTKPRIMFAGVEKTLNSNRWQTMPENFWISFTITSKSPDSRRDEIKDFLASLARRAGDFQSSFGIQLDWSRYFKDGPFGERTIDELLYTLNRLDNLGVPIGLKVSPLIDISFLHAVQEQGICKIINCASNILLGANTNPPIDWTIPTLKDVKAKSVCGEFTFPILINTIESWRSNGIVTPIMAGGALTIDDVYDLRKAGANCILIDVAQCLYPWRAKILIKSANFLGNNKIS